MIVLPDGVGFPDILGGRMQIGMVVSDIEAAARFWSEEMGIGPWIMIEDSLEDRRFVHRGRESKVEMSLALSYAGQTQVELIAQANDAPSPYLEFLQGGREGVQHLEFWPDDYARSCEALERAGFEELSAIYLPDGTKNASYYLSPPVVGVVVAVVPMTPFRRTYMTAIESLVAAWDGSRPLRRFSTRADFIASDDFRLAQQWMADRGAKEGEEA
jgi:catechol 2,3-dioxygenase-like lactoylglutathione lyase family enzyme